MSTKQKSSWPMIALGIITLVLSSYGLYELAHIYGSQPAGIAVLAVSVFDLFAIASGVMAFRVAKDGDSPAFWNFVVVLVGLLSATLQYARTQLGGQPWPVGVLMAMAPLATLCLFEGTLRRAYRLGGRRTGRVAQPRASFELLQWLIFRKATWEAFRDGVKDRTLSADAAFKLALLRLEDAEDIDWTPPPRREIELDYAEDLSGRAAITAGIRREIPPESAGAAEVPPDTRPLSAVVQETLQVTGVDKPGKEAAFAAVTAAKPAAKPESVRREIRRQTEIRSA